MLTEEELIQKHKKERKELQGTSTKTEFFVLCDYHSSYHGSFFSSFFDTFFLYMNSVKIKS